MDTVSDMEFCQCFEKYIDLLTDPEKYSKDKLLDSLFEIARLFRISKGVTEFYVNEAMERSGEGEIYCDYDDGRGGPAVVALRYVSQSQAVIKGTIYRPESEPPLSEKELRRLETAVR